MILSFNIEYRTNWGEEVRISGLFPESIPLHTTDGIYWTAEVELEIPHEGMAINYNYQIEQNGIVIRKEWDSFPRSIFLSGTSKKIYRINDCWKNIPEQSYLYSSAFTEALLAHPERESIPQSYKKGLVIKAYAPHINKDYCLAICGNQKSLGHWDPEKAVLMSDVHFPEWQIELDASKLKYPLEYKFILYNKQEKKADCWEKNPNRYLADPELKTNETLVISDRYAYFDIPAWKGAGIAIPVFSLKSEKSFGVGDFGDLRRMIDWAVITHQKVIQILPVNDTTMTHAWTDSYPYNSISIYAFHPMYADIKQMGTLKDKEAASKFNKKQKELNSLPAIDYEAVNQTKWEFFNLLFRQEGKKVLASKGFKDFFEANKEWLQPYAVFSYLRDAYKTPNFRKWPRHSVYNAEDIEKMCQPETVDYPHISLYYYIQYHLHLQLLSATEYARQHGVVLKGDIPIGISRNSVEAWTEPHYFNLNGQAGARSLFDAPLHFKLFTASQQGRDFDMRTLLDDTLVQKYPTLAVTFVDNHDSQRGSSLESQVKSWFKPLAYGLILLMKEGYPCVFYGDYYSMKGEGSPHRPILDILLDARRSRAFGEQTDYFDHPNTVGFTRSGDAQHPDSGLALLLSNGEDGEKVMSVGVMHANETWHEITGSYDDELTIGDDGKALFKVHGGKLAVWVRKKD